MDGGDGDGHTLQDLVTERLKSLPECYLPQPSKVGVSMHVGRVDTQPSRVFCLHGRALASPTRSPCLMTSLWPDARSLPLFQPYPTQPHLTSPCRRSRNQLRPRLLTPVPATRETWTTGTGTVSPTFHMAEFSDATWACLVLVFFLGFVYQCVAIRGRLLKRAHAAAQPGVI